MTKNYQPQTKLSVLLISYQHEKGIREALESILSQKTQFDFEVICADDSSSDGTENILKKYQIEYGNKIKLILRPKNLGIMGNFLDGFSRCQGEYIALLDGDDAWIDNTKLQKQIDFLDANPSFSVCGHSIKVVEESTGRSYDTVHWDEKDLDLKTLFVSTPLHTSSVVFRSSAILPLPSCMKDLTHWDWGLLFWARQRGRAAQLPQVMSKYRIHSDGVWSGAIGKKRQNQFIENRMLMKSQLTGKIRIHCDRTVTLSRLESFCSALLRGEYQGSALLREESLTTYLQALFSPAFLHKVNRSLRIRPKKNRLP